MNNATPRRPNWRGATVVDRTGQRFDKLIVVRRAENLPLPPFSGKSGKRQRSRVQWLCRCDCGNERTVSIDYLIRKGSVKSCGCSKYDPRRTLYNFKNPLPAGRAARNIVFATYRTSARRRGFSWELTGEQFDEITGQDCHYCGCPPSSVKRNPYRNSSEWTYNGIDRVDSSVGYTPENVVPCCEICNKAKRDLSYGEFMAWIARLTEYHWFHPDVMPSRLLREVKESASDIR